MTDLEQSKYQVRLKLNRRNVPLNPDPELRMAIEYLWSIT